MRWPSDFCFRGIGAYGPRKLRVSERLGTAGCVLIVGTLLLGACQQAGRHDEIVPNQPNRAVDINALTLDLGGGVTLDFVLIPAGTFTMGSTDEEDSQKPQPTTYKTWRESYDKGWYEVTASRPFEEEQWEKPRHVVTIGKPFYLGKYEVTQAQWQSVMGDNPSDFRGDVNLPVEQVSWQDCRTYCRKLSELTGRAARLPTEAEWEYACRAGTTGAFAGTGALHDMGWCADNSGDRVLDSRDLWDNDMRHYFELTESNNCRTHVVGQKRGNAWGLYDMHGNVAEHCADRFDNYPGGSLEIGFFERWYHTTRGGDFLSPPYYCRSARRDRCAADVREKDLGLRVVVEVEE
jgi:formylglycine-generating enzyme required for sulfatase activity